VNTFEKVSDLTIFISKINIYLTLPELIQLAKEPIYYIERFLSSGYYIIWHDSKSYQLITLLLTMSSSESCLGLLVIHIGWPWIDGIREIKWVWV